MVLVRIADLIGSLSSQRLTTCDKVQSMHDGMTHLITRAGKDQERSDNKAVLMHQIMPTNEGSPLVAVMLHKVSKAHMIAYWSDDREDWCRH